MCHKRRIGGQLYHVCITFKTCYERSLRQGAFPVVFIFRTSSGYTLCSVLTSKYLRPVSVIAIVTVSIFSKPFWAFVIMFINNFCSDFMEFFHSVFEIIALRERTASGHNNDIGVLLFYRLIEHLIALYIIWTPLFISNTYIF